MSIEIKRKQGESVGGVLRRFREKVKRSGVLNLAKTKKFHQSRQSRRLQKEGALQRINTREKMDHFRKIGKIK